MRPFSLLSAFFFFFCSAQPFADAATLNEYVRLEVHPTSTIIRPGTSAVVEFRLVPVEGIHVNVDPPVKFSLDSAAGISLDGEPVMTTDSSTGYLSTRVPVHQRIMLGKQVAPGRISVKGTLTYFFCSDSEGWCNRRKEPVEFTILVKP